nr:cell surface protein [uncultured Acidovorax sp.]
MKKSILSASIAAMIGGLGLAGVAGAAVHVPAANVAVGLNVNEAGTGHILMVPYFTTQGTNATLLNITNTDTVNGKLVKVRFRGASNSDDIFDFTLALSPGDVWAAKVSQGADGRSQLETADKSCTLPSIVATQKNSFPTGRLPASFTDAQKANETREGYVEILTMADIQEAGNNNQGTTVPAKNPLFTAIKHVSGVAPCTSTVLDLLKTDTVAYSVAGPVLDTTTAQGKGLAYPTGKLMANWTIIDVVKTATFSGAATAVKAGALNDNTNINANVVFFPQADDAAGDVDALTADPLLRRTQIYKSTAATGALASYGITNAGTATVPAPSGASTSPIISASFYDLPDLSTPYTAANSAANFPPIAQAKALTTALAAKSVTNEYLTTTSIAATTDWVFSSPTRRYNVAMNYGYTSPVGGDGRVYTDWFNTAATLGPGNAISTATDANNFFNVANTAVSSGKICVAADTGAAGVNQWDREETTTSSQFVISPGTVSNVRFCGEVSVLAINNGTNTTSGSMSASLALQNLNVNSNEGWISLGTSGLNGKGLPVLGGAFAKSSAFGAMWPHRFTR